jgi:serine/threonine-protein kinase
MISAPLMLKFVAEEVKIARLGMQVTYGYCSSAGLVREHNEDDCAFWEPEERSEVHSLGAISVVADGVGGQGHGEVASRTAVDEAIRVFRESDPAIPATQLINAIFDAANLAVYNAGMDPARRVPGEGRMATTLTVCVFRHNSVTIGHIGDCRVYILRPGRVERITNDHSYVGVQIKLGLLTVEEARTSELRTLLTKSVGQDPFIRADCHNVRLTRGDRLLICSDGVHAFVSEQELYVIASKMAAAQACEELIALVAARGGDDNATVQVIHIQAVDDVWYYRGAPIRYDKEKPKPREAEPSEIEHMASEVTVGSVLDGRFTLTDVIARSGMATIFKANDETEQRAVAIKVPLMQFESDPGFYTRFAREEEIGARLSHPYIMRVIPVKEKNRPYLVMELLQGQTLGHLMKSVKPLPVSDALRIVSRICEALIYLHEHGIVHRDLKPDNVMLCDDGSIRIMDFGIAKSEEGRRLTFGSFQPAMGTPDYMAPEQVKGKRGDARTDIYALGAILYEMVTGSSPFSGDNPLVIMNARLTGDPNAPRKLNAQIPPPVEEIILKAMARDPSDRYASADEFKHDLDHPDEVHVTGRAERLVAPSMFKAKTRTMRYTILGLIIPVAVAAGFLISAYLHRTGAIGGQGGGSVSPSPTSATAPPSAR